MTEIISCLSLAGPYITLIPMQPRPRADTSKLLFPSLRFCIVSSALERTVGGFGQLFIGSCHVEPFLDRWCYSCERVASGGKQPRRVLHAGDLDEGVAELYRVSLLLAVV